MTTLNLLALLGACLAVMAIRPAAGLAAPSEPVLAFQPASYDFGLQQVNSGGGQTTLQLQNVSSSETVWVESLYVSGPGSGNFWVSNSGCYGQMLEPGNTCWVQVQFNPYDMAEYEAQLHATASGYEAIANLSGSGGYPLFEADSNPASFGGAAVGGPGVTREIEVVNNGNLAGGLFIAVVSGGAVGSFQLLDESCTGRSLAPSSHCVLQVRFQPLAEGVKTATLSLFGEGDGGTQIALTGIGLPAVPSGSSSPSSSPPSAADSGVTTVNSVVNVTVGRNAAKRAKARRAARRALRRHRRIAVRSAQRSFNGGTDAQIVRVK